MRSLVKFITCACSAAILAGAGATAPPQLPENWRAILSSVGLTQSGFAITVVREDTPMDVGWRSQVEAGGLLILEGESEAARTLGFRPTPKRTRITAIIDAHSPKLPIIWETPAELFATEVPPNARIFARERWTSAPVMAGLRLGKGAILWVAAPTGPGGYERYPYVLQALYDLDLHPLFRSNRLWAFFDWSYRMRVDVDYFAERWHEAGIAALHVAAWHFNEPDPTRDEYLRKLIDACHHRGIAVYAWFELPHVSEQFWNDHPQWREKTALLQDAHLDWRKLMNLQNRECFAAAAKQTRDLVNRFDWDGVNLAELYFESLEGSDNLARFTPFNDDVRKEFQRDSGADPVDVLRTRDTERLKSFLTYRAGLARKMQQEWIAEFESSRKENKPYLDLVLTHVDDRFDTRMRDLIGADAARVLPMLESHDFTFLVEDPATIWNLGPARYEQIAARYAPLTHRPEKLAIDVNIVERYQDVYPTKQQTGTELFQLIHTASTSFPRVALYFENSILPADLGLLPASAAVVENFERNGTALKVTAPRGAGVSWTGPANVDGNLWPVSADAVLWLPPGTHTIESASKVPPLRLTSFNGDIQTARSTDDGLEIAYSSSARAIAILDRNVVAAQVDGTALKLGSQPGTVLFLPRGSHRATLHIR